MANWNVLKTTIANVIKTNGNQEITGAVLQNVLSSIVSNVGLYSTYIGFANTLTNVGVPDGPVFLIANTEGVYSNLGGIELKKGEIAILRYDNGVWVKHTILDSTKIESIKDIYNEKRIISANQFHASSFTNLESALTAIPTNKRIGYAIVVAKIGNSIDMYSYISSSATNEEDWLNLSYWNKLASISDIDSKIKPLSDKISEVEETFTDSFDTLRTNSAIQIKSINDKINSVGEWYNYFNGEGAFTQNDVVTISKDGDSLEIDFEAISDAMGIGGYAFTKGICYSQIAIAITTKQITIRAADDNTWLLPLKSIDLRGRHTLKIDYAAGNINFYIDSSLIHTYTGQMPISFVGFGNGARAPQYGYWKGYIYSIAVNGKKNILEELAGYSSHDLQITRKNLFLTDEQALKLDSFVHYPKSIVKYYKTLDKFEIYMHLKDDIYTMLDMIHVINNSEEVYLNYWRLAGKGGLYEYSNGDFKPKGLELLLGVENEFAMSFKGRGDFTGGHHGDERIDIDPSSFVKFFVDGIELSDLSEDKTIECGEFSMIIASTLHETIPVGTQEPVAGHPIIAKHWKKTTIKDNGYNCINKVIFDFSSVGEESREVRAWFSGLVCVSKDAATTSYGEDFVIHNTSIGDNTTYGVDKQIPSSKAVFFNQDKKLSCTVTSKWLTGDDKQCYITLWDRPQDTKYYRYIPNKVVANLELFMTEMDVKWDYHK